MKEKIQDSLKGILSDLYDNSDFNIDQYVINIQENKMTAKND